MPQRVESRTEPAQAEAFFRDFDFDALLKASIEQQGFTATLKSLNKVRLPRSPMMTVIEGVVEEQPSGRYDAAFQTDRGRLVLRGAERVDRESVDPQLVPSNTGLPFQTTSGSGQHVVERLLRELADAGSDAPSSLLCEIELLPFDSTQREAVLPLLWQYILDHRDSNDRSRLAAVAAAIRKYIAIMPMDRMVELAVLLEAGHRSPLPTDLEVEVVKMIYRNFEVHPPVVADPQPELAQRLWEMVQAYINPRILLRDKHAAIASLAVEAIVAMRSPLAERAWRAVRACPYRWFTELVSDDLGELHGRWSSKNPDAAAWLRQLRNNVSPQV